MPRRGEADYCGPRRGRAGSCSGEPDDFKEDMDEAERAIPVLSRRNQCVGSCDSACIFVRDSITTFSGAVGAGMTNAEATLRKIMRKCRGVDLYTSHFCCWATVPRARQLRKSTGIAVGATRTGTGCCGDARDPAWRRSRFWDGTDYATATFMRYECITLNMRDNQIKGCGPRTRGCCHCACSGT